MSIRVIVLPCNAVGPSPRHNWQADAGDDLLLSVQVRPVRDISTWTLSLVFSDRTGAVKLTLLSTDPSAYQVVDGPGGNANFTLSALNSGTTLGAGEWNYKVLRTDNGNTTTFVRGRASLKGD